MQYHIISYVFIFERNYFDIALVDNTVAPVIIPKVKSNCKGVWTKALVDMPTAIINPPINPHVRKLKLLNKNPKTGPEIIIESFFIELGYFDQLNAPRVITKTKKT